MGHARGKRLNQVYAAIADPTRRGILAALSGGDARVGSLVDRFPISFNGVSKHVKVLERAGLVERTIRGREHWLHLKAEPLSEAAAWLERYSAFWTARLEALEAMLVARDHAPGRAAHVRRRG